MRVVVTEIVPDGEIRRRGLDTSALNGAGRWENLIQQLLASPPLYRAAPGSSVYVIHACDRAVLVGEPDVTGPLRDLLTTILAAASRPRGPRSLPLRGIEGLAAGARGTPVHGDGHDDGLVQRRRRTTSSMSGSPTP